MVCNKIKENRFSLKGNGIMSSSFLGRQFYCPIPYKAPIALGICTQLANLQMVWNKKRRQPVFIKGKWNHVVDFSRAIILSFHPVEGSYRSWDLYTTGQLVDGVQKKKEKKKKTVFINAKWNHVLVISTLTILSFHPVEGSYRCWYSYTTGQDGLLQQQQKKTKQKKNGFH